VHHCRKDLRNEHNQELHDLTEPNGASLADSVKIAFKKPFDKEGKGEN
jgi:hypothetical protein